MSKHELQITKITFTQEKYMTEYKCKKTGEMKESIRSRKIEKDRQTKTEHFLSMYNLEAFKNNLEFDAENQNYEYEFKIKKAGG